MFPPVLGRSGELIALPPSEPVRIVGDGALFSEALVCELSPYFVTCHLGASFEWSDRHLESALNMSDRAIHIVLRRLAEELRSPGIASETLIDLLAGQLAIELARYWKAIPDGRAAGGLAAWRLRIVDERLQIAGPPPCLRELAQLCRMSVRQLTRGFRASRASRWAIISSTCASGRPRRF
jgi:AraC family transcriptional regulator